MGENAIQTSYFPRTLERNTNWIKSKDHKLHNIRIIPFDAHFQESRVYISR